MSHGLVALHSAADVHRSCELCVSASLTSLVKGCRRFPSTPVLKLNLRLLKHPHDRWQVNTKISLFFFWSDLCLDSLPITLWSDLLWTLPTLWIRYSAAALFTSPSFQTNFPLKTIQPQSPPLPGIYLSPHKLFSILHRLTAIPLRLQIQGLGTRCMLICVGVTRWNSPHPLPQSGHRFSGAIPRGRCFVALFSRLSWSGKSSRSSSIRIWSCWATATTACRTEQQIIAPWKAPLLWSQRGMRSRSIRWGAFRSIQWFDETEMFVFFIV